MVKRKFSKNILPLLAITVLFLSVAVVNYDQSLIPSSNSTKGVLSESDENKEDEKNEEKVEEKSNEKSEDKKEVKSEERKEDEKSKSNSDRIRINSKVEIDTDDDDDLSDDVNDDIDKKDTDDEDEVDDETETEFEEESEIVSPDGSVNKFKLKIKSRTKAGKTVIETAAGEVEVSNSPEDVVSDLVENGLFDDPISIEVKENENEKVEFEVQGTDSKKFLGIINVIIPKTITVSSETGEVVSTNQNIWSRILSLLSI